MEPKQKQYPAVDVTGDRSKVQFCKKQYCIGTWNVKLWAVVAEAIQTILRRENYPNPYETLKALTRTGAGINHEVIADFIETLEVSESVKEELRAISPMTYTGF